MATLVVIFSVLFVVINITSAQGGNTFTANDLLSFEQCANLYSFAKYPWMALLHYGNNNLEPNGGKGGFFCGGTLIHENYVLTAAQCVRDPSQKHYDIDSVQFSLYRDCENKKEDECDDVRSVPIAEVIVHENYDPSISSHANDIALIRLQRAAPKTDYIEPICLPLDASLQTKNYDGSEFVVAGFGRTESASQSTVLMEADTKGYNLDQCSKIYRDASSMNLTNKQICAGGEKGNGNICSGDAGGPLMAYETRNGIQFNYLVGVATFGSKECGAPGFPDVFTRVDQYIDWILKHMKK